jgi:hypothetical protein
VAPHGKRQRRLHQHREAENAAILALVTAQNVTIKEILRRTDKSRGLVPRVMQSDRTDIFRHPMSSLDQFLTQLKNLATRWVSFSNA